MKKTIKNITLLGALALALLLPQQTQPVNWKTLLAIGGIGTLVVVAYCQMKDVINTSNKEVELELQQSKKELVKTYAQNIKVWINDELTKTIVEALTEICSEDILRDQKNDSDIKILNAVYQYTFDDGRTIVDLAKGTSAEEIINTYNPFKIGNVEKLEIENNNKDEIDEHTIEINLKEYKEEEKETKKKFLDYRQTYTPQEYAYEIKRCIESKNPCDHLIIEKLFEVVQGKNLLTPVLSYDFSQNKDEELRLCHIANNTDHKKIILNYYSMHVQKNLLKKN